MIDLKDFRSQTGWSQSEMAEKLGYNSKDAISKIERGERKMSGPARKALQLLAEKHNIQP